MVLFWTVFGFFCLVGAMMQPSLNTASGCVAMANCSNLLTMSCSGGRHIFLLKAQFGHKSADSSCSTSPSCDDCCNLADSDCLSDFSVYQFSLLYDNNHCWKGTSCQPQVQQGQTDCGLSTFAVAHYSCLRGEDMTDFHRNVSITAPAVAIHYDSSDVTSYPVDTDSFRTWRCQVDTTDSVQRQADVILVREVHSDGGKSGTSSMEWSGGGGLGYTRLFDYTSFNATTPFSLSVRVGERRRIPDGWAVVRTQDGSNLAVQCGYTDDILSTSTTSAETGPPSSSTMQTIKPSEKPNVLKPSTKGSEGSQEITHLAVAVAGWVVAAVLAGCLAVVICRLGGSKGMAQLCSKGQTTSDRLTSPRDQAGDDTYLEVIPDSAGPASHSSHAYVNAAGVHTSSLSAEPSQPEYSPLDWCRDSTDAYSQLGQK